MAPSYLILEGGTEFTRELTVGEAGVAVMQLKDIKVTSWLQTTVEVAPNGGMSG